MPTAPSTQPSTAPATPDATTGAAAALRRLHALRAVAAIVWAVLIVLVGREVGPLATVLLVLYPLVDVAGTVVDARITGRRATSIWLWLNGAVSLLAAIGLALSAGSGTTAVLRIWGVWAIVAGLLQLVVALRRRSLGGRGAMLLSGGISVLAGGGFVAMAGGAEASLLGVAGYATLGGIFFGISALRLGRTARQR
jgi:uncharacterized membrane protein HdeD (DUF308 family)